MTKDQAILRLKEGTPFSALYVEEWENALSMAIEALQERKTGKWVHLPNVWGVVFCSECNYDLRINDTKYCPNCGAKMEDDDGRKPMVDQK